MELFFRELGNKIQDAVKEETRKILKEASEEKIYAAALVTDSDCITLFLAVNTYEYMKKKDEEYIEMFQEDLTEEYTRRVMEGSASFTKWIPDEWGYSDGKDSGLNEVSRLLFEKEEKLNPKDYQKYKELFFETVISAFKNLIGLKVFGESQKEMTFYISISDDEKSTEIENYSARLLNPEKIYKEFLKRTDGYEENNS